MAYEILRTSILSRVSDEKSHAVLMLPVTVFESNFIQRLHEDALRCGMDAGCLLLPCGDAAEKETREKIKALKAKHRLLLLGCPPHTSDCGALKYSDIADKAIVLLKKGKTTHSQFESALRDIGHIDIDLLGVALI